MMNRYPGPRSFTGDDRHLFFGRESEKQELFRLIVLNEMVVLFGESGAGKTSLLQAGVCPELEERGYRPVFIRLNNTAETPELQVCRRLKEGGYIPADMPEDRTLWEYFSRFWYVDLGEVFTPVIVFDQFEELFTLYKPGERRQFINQFAAIANGRPPAGLPPEAATPPRVKFVFGIRSDFLYLLDELSADIPAILRCRFQLRPLDRDRAAEAITRPSAMPGNFLSAPFAFSPAALNSILESLGRHDAPEALQTGAPGTHLEIAAFQLQLVCRRLEARIIDLQCPPGFAVTPDFYGGTAGIKQIIDEFYNAVVEKIPLSEREAVEKLLARGLIRNGRRIMMEESAMRDEYEVSQTALGLLHEERLLNREARKGELYYEISHDTLVKPVLERFKKIEEAEARAKEAAERERLRLENEKRRRERDRARRIAAIGILLSVLAAGAAVFALIQTRAAKKQETEALYQKTQADSLLKVSEANRKLADEQTLLANEKTKEAQLNADRAEKQTIATLIANRNTAKALEELKITSDQAVTILLAEIDRNIYRLEYDSTYLKCRTAVNLKAQRQAVEQRIFEIAFFYAEADTLAAAIRTLQLIRPASLKENTPDAQAQLRALLKESMPPALYVFLQNRYFGKPLPVEGGTFLREDSVRIRVDAFQLTETEVTFWQYAVFAKAKNHDMAPPSWQYAGDNPAVNVSWNDAAFYANWRSEREGLDTVYTLTKVSEDDYDVVINWTGDLPAGKAGLPADKAGGYRLPTEAEWEYATRGGIHSKGFVYSGDSILSNVAWYDENSNSRTQPVKRKNPNELGFYDMSGNAWEWCNDWYRGYSPDENENPRGPEEGDYRVIRGGCWFNVAGNCRADYRGHSWPGGRLDYFGFRLLRPF